MSRYNTIIPNDVANGEGVCVSFFVQGCPHHCPGCFNPETWDFIGGQEYTSHTKWEIIKAINANGIVRNFSVLGGEPLAPQNLPMTEEVVTAVRTAYPDIKIFLWTGYSFELLPHDDEKLIKILECTNVIIDGQFIESRKNLDLKLRGSDNQRIWKKDNQGFWRESDE
jgi:anaerobic ribonucleoside-triphosphate reductase activating protein